MLGMFRGIVARADPFTSQHPFRDLVHQVGQAGTVSFCRNE
jgi:hypothetical protein